MHMATIYTCSFEEEEFPHADDVEPEPEDDDEVEIVSGGTSVSWLCKYAHMKMERR